MNKKYLLELFNNGESAIKIAVRENICITELIPLFQNAYENGITNSKPFKPYASLRDEQIINYWNSGQYTYESISKFYGITRERIRQILSKHKRRGYLIKSTKAVSESRHLSFIEDQINSHTIDQVKEMYLEGIPKSEILQSTELNNEAYELVLANLKKQNKVSSKLRIFNQIKDSRENIGQLKKYRYSIILRMRKDNRKLIEIADELGVSKIRLTQIINSMRDIGIEIPNSRDSGSPMDADELLERLNEIEAYLDDGLAINEIGTNMRMSPHHVANLIYKHFVRT